MRSAVLFPGLAPAGFAAIGDFLSHSRVGQRRVAQAEEVLGYPLLEAFRAGGTADWVAYDCAYLACGVALGDQLRERLDAGDGDTPPVACAGVSFGGFAAAVHASGIEYRQAVRLVAHSAAEQIHHLADWPEPAGCLFFYRLGGDVVASIVAGLRAAGHWVEVSADLGMDVHGVSGSLATLAVVKAEVTRHGGSPVYTMDRPQHCAALTGLRDILAEQIYPAAGIRAPAVPIVSDVDGSTVRSAAELSRTLLYGWTEPVRTRFMVETLLTQGVRRLYLVGPRTMFTRLLRDTFDVVAVTPESVLAGAAR